MIPQEFELFMTSFTNYRIPIIFLPIIHPVKKKKVKTESGKAEAIEKLLVQQLFHSLESASFFIDEQPYLSLFKTYNHEFLSFSISKGVIDPSNLSLLVRELLL